VIKVGIFFIAVSTFFSLVAEAQFSVATDGSILRNLNSRQKFWAFGQTVQLNFYPTSGNKNAIYAWVSYYTNGKFKNNFFAAAKDISTTPQEFPYRVHTSLRYRNLSVGWKHYFKGGYNAETIWNIYGLAGFGLLLGKAENSYNQSIDTALYLTKPPKEGNGAFKRMTLDMALGTEFPLGTAVFVYTEARTWIPTSHYPSEYLYEDNYNIPAVLAINVGLRVLIE
jgi:hypothetical protein